MAGSTSQLAVYPNNQSHQRVEEETSQLAAKRHSAVAYSITHALPTKVGFCVPRISEDPEYLQRLQALLAYEPWIIIQQVNRIAGSIVITYQSGIMPDSEIRLYLANLIQSADSPKQTMSAEEKAASVSSQSQKSTRPSVGQQKQKDHDAVEVGVSSNPQFVGKDISLNSQWEWVGVSSASKSIEKETVPSTESREMDKVPALQNQSTDSPEKIYPTTKLPPAVTYSIAHAIPGRVRFRIPQIGKDSKYVQRLEALLKAEPTAIGEHPFGASALRYRVNSAAASIVITYKSEAMQNSQKRCWSLLEQAISYLSSLIQSAASDTVISPS